MSKKESVAVQVGDKEITFETGQIAKQANGAIIVRCGETILFCSACASKNALENVDFLPLRVDYQEKFSAAGKTVGGFFKREGRPREKEVLTCRLIDRPLRPLFPDGYHNEVQILSYVWSYDGEVTTEPLAICGASAALAISQIPLKKTVGAVRVGKLEGKLVVNPSPKRDGEFLSRSRSCGNRRLRDDDRRILRLPHRGRGDGGDRRGSQRDPKDLPPQLMHFRKK